MTVAPKSCVTVRRTALGAGPAPRPQPVSATAPSTIVSATAPSLEQPAVGPARAIASEHRSLPDIEDDPGCTPRERRAVARDIVRLHVEDVAAGRQRFGQQVGEARPRADLEEAAMTAARRAETLRWRRCRRSSGPCRSGAAAGSPRRRWRGPARCRRAAGARGHSDSCGVRSARRPSPRPRRGLCRRRPKPSTPPPAGRSRSRTDRSCRRRRRCRRERTRSSRFAPNPERSPAACMFPVPSSVSVAFPLESVVALAPPPATVAPTAGEAPRSHWRRR